MMIMFIAKFDSQEELDMANIMDPDKINIEMLRKAFMNANYCNALKTLLPFLNKRGFLDTLLPNAPNTAFMTALIKEMMEKMQPPQEAVKDAATENSEEPPARVECAEE